MTEGLNNSKQEDVTDFSDRVKTAFLETDSLLKMKLRLALVREARNLKNLEVTVDYTTLDDAKFLKGFLQSEPTGGKWKFSIRATESQMKEAANVFASGVDWIPVNS